MGKLKELKNQDRILRSQLIWSAIVALVLGITALFHFSGPKNALLETDNNRSPASLGFRGSALASPSNP